MSIADSEVWVDVDSGGSGEHRVDVGLGRDGVRGIHGGVHPFVRARHYKKVTLRFEDLFDL